MKRRAVRSLKAIGKNLVIGWCVVAQIAIGFGNAPSATAATATTREAPDPPAPPVKVNRTVPKVEPPRAGLNFSANPTVDEIFRARVFEEPLVPIGGEPTSAENAILAAALQGYAKRSGPDDFSSLTSFLDQHPQSSWRAALWTDLGLEYYNTAHYSLALDAWTKAWALAKDATNPKAKAIGDRAAGELAYMYGRLGRMNELDVLLKSVEGRVFCGPATESISGARAGLSNMKNRPEIAFRCGALALHRIKLAVDPKNPGDAVILKSASTQMGFSLPQVAELSSKVGLNYQMAFRKKGAAFVVPSVVHWKVGHYAAMIRQEGNRYLLQDPTFLNDVWVTAQALEAETSGYFLVPPGLLPKGWRAVALAEGGAVWGKGDTCCNDKKPHGCKDKKKPDTCPPQPPCPNSRGMAVASAHLMLVSLNIVDEPVGYSPPVGLAPRFVVTYNQREAYQPSTFTYSNFGPKWTFGWLSYITDNPLSPSTDVNYYMMGGGTRTFTGFDSNTQTFANEQFDQTRLTRTGPASYELLAPDGSKNIFNQSDGSLGTTRKLFLTQILDPFGNALSLAYDADFRLVALTDAIGQVTTISYQHPTDIYKITRVTDPFGRFATFDYDASLRLIKITDVIGLTSQFAYDPGSDFINALITPYGTNTFIKAENGTTRSLETIYPDGDRDRVEYNESTTLGIPASVPTASVPVGMATHNDYLYYRNTYYWSKIACAGGYGDYTKAKIYHWLHTADLSSASGILESTKEALEGRVWYDYAGQSDPIIVGTTSLPTHVGRVLDDGSTQLYTYEHDGFGHVTKTIDPVGRTFSYIYATNGIDLLEVRQTRAGAAELLSQRAYDDKHNPTAITYVGGQVATFTHNSRGQLLTRTLPGNLVLTHQYDTNGYLVGIDGPLPGSADSITFTYDAYGRKRTITDWDGYTRTLDYDALSRPTRITFPDGTFEQLTYYRLDMAVRRDRAGRTTSYEYNPSREMIKKTDPLNRTTYFQWCKCGDSRTVTDALGRTTTWLQDIQGRVTSKQFADGSRITYKYENTTSRVLQSIDEQLQVTEFAYNIDDTPRSVSYVNTRILTEPVSYTYDRNYNRPASMTDGSGTSLFSYYPITSAAAPGAGQLASVDGPLPNDTITFTYDALGRRVSKAIDGVADSLTLDEIGRTLGETNALGTFTYAYDGSSQRVLSMGYPNGQTTLFGYLDNAGDRRLAQITNAAGAVNLSEFQYTYDLPEGRIATWSERLGTDSPRFFTMGYDVADQLASVSVTSDATLVKAFGYSYDAAGNRLREQIDARTNVAIYNALNQLTEDMQQPATTTNEWDAAHRLVAVSSANHRTEFSYDGMGRRVGIREQLSGVETSNKRFVWCDGDVCEERSAAGAVTKRFFNQGVKVEAGANAGSYFYTRDHLNSIRELTDSSANVRARYDYDPFGRRTRIGGDSDSDFAFGGFYYDPSDALCLATFREYDPALGRWLSRDPLPRAESTEGPNLYTYVANNPVNRTDPLGLFCNPPPPPGPAPPPGPPPACKNPCPDCDKQYNDHLSSGGDCAKIICLAPPPYRLVWSVVMAPGIAFCMALVVNDANVEYLKCRISLTPQCL